MSAAKSEAKTFEEVEFGEDLPTIDADISLPNVQTFAKAAEMMAGRFIDHDEARKAGLPSAIVPGIMSQGILVSLIHAWAPNAEVLNVDTIFRALVLVDSKATASGVVTDIDDETKIIEIDLMIKNEKGETPVVGTAKIRL
ncbi:MAG: MaoC family dehydratase [Myxococcota bacterium]